MNANDPSQPGTPPKSGDPLIGDSATSGHPPLVPDYGLIRRIGHGAYGDVWLARSKATGALRAAKIVWRHTFENDRPFKREFEGIQSFERISREHPSQLALFHIGRNEAEGYFYYVMELADDAVERKNEEGRMQNEVSARGAQPVSSFSLQPSAFERYAPHTLRADLEHGRLPAAKVLEIGLTLTEALSHLHSNGLVHRDVKPSNVIFVNGRPKLADIGLVTDASDQCSIVGTEGYLPPEGPGTPQADIFALGKVLYEAATGRDRRDFPDLPPEIRSWPDAPQVFELNEIILRACSKDSGQRYANAESMLGELQRLDGGKSVRRARQAERGWRLARRGAAWLTATAAVLALIVLASRVRQTPIVPHVEKRSTNETANILYDLGKTHFFQFTGTNFAKAADLFLRAIQADTNFAPAYGYLAATYFWSSDKGWNPNWEFLPQAKEIALQALALDQSQSLAEPHLALGWYRTMKEWNWSEAEKEYKRAIELDPSAFCHLCYAEFLRVVGRMSEALKEINEARSRDPNSLIINSRLANYLRDYGRFNEALVQVEQVLARDSNRAGMEEDILCALNRYGEAIEAERKRRSIAGESKEKLERELGELKRAVETEGPKAYWRRALKNATKWNDAYGQIRAHVQLGETEETFAGLTNAVKDHEVWFTFHVKTDWALNPVRKEPRFRAILNTMHLE